MRNVRDRSRSNGTERSVPEGRGIGSWKCLVCGESGPGGKRDFYRHYASHAVPQVRRLDD